jgi:hypothetical protein
MVGKQQDRMRIRQAISSKLREIDRSPFRATKHMVWTLSTRGERFESFLIGCGCVYELDRLDLDHIRAHIRQILHGGRTLEKVTEANDFHSIEQHGRFPHLSRM